MSSYKCKYNRCYEESLTEGKVYEGKEEPGIFANSPFLVIGCDDNGKKTIAHLHRFDRITAQQEV